MRHELTNVKAIMQKAGHGAGLYQEQIRHARNTCRPDFIVKEVESYAAPLKASMEKAKAEAFEQLDALTAAIKAKSRLNIQNYRADIVEFVKTMKPGREDLEALAKQFENETMLQFFHKYRDEQQMIADLPMCYADRLKYVQRIRDDLGYVFDEAGEPFDIEKNRNAHTMLQHWGDTFEQVFADRIEAIGDFL